MELTGGMEETGSVAEGGGEAGMDNLAGGVDDAVGREPELGNHLLTGTGKSESVEAHDRAGVSDEMMPAPGDARLDGNARYAGREDGSMGLGVPGFNAFHGRHRDDANPKIVLAQAPGGLAARCTSEPVLMRTMSGLSPGSTSSSTYAPWAAASSGTRSDGRTGSTGQLRTRPTGPSCVTAKRQTAVSLASAGRGTVYPGMAGIAMRCSTG